MTLPLVGNLNGTSRGLVFCGLALALIGVALVYSATHTALSSAEHGLYVKQLAWIVASLAIFAGVVRFPMRFHEAFAYIYLGIVMVLLLGLMFYGRIGGGAVRWYDLGFFNFQPSEMAKVVMVIVLARYLSYSKRTTYDFRKLLGALALSLVPTALILKQPDLGTSLVLLAVTLVMLFWSGIPGFFLLLIVSPVFSMATAFHPVSWIIFFVVLLLALYLMRPGALLTSLAIAINLLVGMVTPLLWNHLADYQKQRILIFLNPGVDPMGAGYQIIQSKIAIGSGGLLGKGFLAGTQTKLEYLPARHTDFIYSVMGEEFGFIGGILVLLLVAGIILLGLRAAMKARNPFHSYVCIGAVTIFFFQSFVNIGMTLGLMPVTGVPLPLVSYGGSSMILSWVLLGLLVNAESNWLEY